MLDHHAQGSLEPSSLRVITSVLEHAAEHQGWRSATLSVVYDLAYATEKAKPQKKEKKKPHKANSIA